MFKEIPASKRALSLRKPICGIGINDAIYMTQQNNKGKTIKCPYYRRWQSMIERCYSVKYQESRPTYKGCSVCDEWLTFSNFKAWMIKQDWKDNHLDKDIVKTGNKIYSPETCLFITSEINGLVCDQSSARGKWPKGVNLDSKSNKFKATCSAYGKKKHLGLFINPNQASEAYNKFKSDHVYEVSTNQSQPLKSYLIRISKELKNKLEITK